MKKVFWFDVETTGTDPKIHGIIEFAYRWSSLFLLKAGADE